MQNTTAKPRDSLTRWRYFALLALAGLALRLFFVLRFPFLTPDSFIYGDIAKNWLTHGVYGLSAATGPEPTLIRMPGYPAVLAALFRLFGVDHYGPVLFLQIVADLGTCFVTADLAARIAIREAPRSAWDSSAARIAFALTALCPFLANYTAVALTETLSVFFAVVALDLAVAAFAADRPCSLKLWLACGLSIAASILLRPDGGILLIIIGGALALRVLFHRPRTGNATALLVLAVTSLSPLIPWTVRNRRTFGVFQPIVPFAANNPEEFVPLGFQRWSRTWLIDYASVEDVAWRPDGDPLDISLVPARAFAHDQERQRVAALFASYNDGLTLTPELDQQFAVLAAERIHHLPLRFYLALPLARSLDMWFRPRTEMLPITPHWWWFDDPKEDAWALLFAAIGLVYAGLAVRGAIRRPRQLWLLLAFVLFRTILVAWTENPEPRYVLECYPIVIALAAIGLRSARPSSPDPR